MSHRDTRLAQLFFRKAWLQWNFIYSIRHSVSSKTTRIRTYVKSAHGVPLQSPQHKHYYYCCCWRRIFHWRYTTSLIQATPNLVALVSPTLFLEVNDCLWRWIDHCARCRELQCKGWILRRGHTEGRFPVRCWRSRSHPRGAVNVPSTTTRGDTSILN